MVSDMYGLEDNPDDPYDFHVNKASQLKIDTLSNLMREATVM